MQMTPLKSIQDGQLEKIRRKVYLNSKGINPNRAMQLDLVFPVLAGNDQRFIPNDYARLCLFTARNKRVPRRVIQHEQLFHLHDSIQAFFTGIELRAEDDELAWLQILYYAKSVPLGESFEFSIRQLCNDLDWPLNGTYYDKARQCISRLKASEVMVINQKAYGNGGAVSLIRDYVFTNDDGCKPTHYKMWIHRDMILFFAGNTFTNHNWTVYRKLAPVARRLADYIESNKHPYPLQIEKFRQVCGSSDTQLKSWRETVKKACKEVEEGKIAPRVWVERDVIHVCCDI